MTVADTQETRTPTGMTVFGSEALTSSIVATWMTTGRGIESRLVAGVWEHRAYGRRDGEQGAS